MNEASFTFSVQPVHLWAILVAVLALWVLVTAILSFHWHSYGQKSPVLSRMQVAYFVGSLIFFISMIGAIIVFI